MLFPDHVCASNNDLGMGLGAYTYAVDYPISIACADIHGVIHVVFEYLQLMLVMLFILASVSFIICLLTCKFLILKFGYVLNEVMFTIRVQDLHEVAPKGAPQS
ncbi:hypothetical protein Cni_G22311 [Canna indica]|uniref:Uncharacterized protein n=1 Tax=Canna indica TaxID=4628 RepID=A0AAQ3KWJ0_9LILI|nr:hypothetical protein Cni_G22311 [Canna indica]